MEKVISRIKSPVVIASLISACLLVLAGYGIIPLNENIKALVDILCYAVLGVGVFNNPADRYNW